MASVGFDFVGFEKLGSKMDALATELVEETQVKMLRAGAKVFKAEMEERAPVLDHKTAQSTSLAPGELKKNIGTYLHRNEVPLEIGIGPNGKVDHVAYWLEYGHRMVHGGWSQLARSGAGKGTMFTGPGTTGDDVPAHPFIRPAFEAGEAPAEMAMIVVFDETMKKAS